MLQVRVLEYRQLDAGVEVDVCLSATSRTGCSVWESVLTLLSKKTPRRSIRNEDTSELLYKKEHKLTFYSHLCNLLLRIYTEHPKCQTAGLCIHHIIHGFRLCFFFHMAGEPEKPVSESVKQVELRVPRTAGLPCLWSSSEFSPYQLLFVPAWLLGRGQISSDLWKLSVCLAEIEKHKGTLFH